MNCGGLVPSAGTQAPLPEASPRWPAQRLASTWRAGPGRSCPHPLREDGRTKRGIAAGETRRTAGPVRSRGTRRTSLSGQLQTSRRTHPNSSPGDGLRIRLVFCGGAGFRLSRHGLGVHAWERALGASRNPPARPADPRRGGSGSRGTKGEQGTPLKVTPPTGPDLELVGAEIRTSRGACSAHPTAPARCPGTELVCPQGRPVGCGLPPADLPAHMRPLPPPQAPAPPSRCRW